MFVVSMSEAGDPFLNIAMAFDCPNRSYVGIDAATFLEGEEMVR